MKSIQWVLDKLEYERKKKKRRPTRNLQKKRLSVDQNVMLCPTCKRFHESLWQEGLKKVVYYTALPTIGKTRKVCYQCRKKKNKTTRNIRVGKK